MFQSILPEIFKMNVIGKVRVLTGELATAYLRVKRPVHLTYQR
jgi:hypothetical protein